MVHFPYREVRPVGSQKSVRPPKVVIPPLPPRPPGEADCGSCTASCQSACKTSCTVGNQACPVKNAPPDAAKT